MIIKKYQYFLIDLDRTLWDFDKNSEMAIYTLIRSDNHLKEQIIKSEKGSETESLKLFFKHYDIINHKLWNEYEKGEMDKETLRWRRFYDAFCKYGITEKEFSINFGERYLQQMICEKELIPGAVEMLEYIKSIGGKIAILSNGFKEVQYHKVERSGIDKYIDTIVISEEVGVHKPSPDIFRIATERLCGFKRCDEQSKWVEAKKRTLMIGDDFINDIEGAQIFGIDQYYYNPKGLDNSGATYEGKTLPSS